MLFGVTIVQLCMLLLRSMVLSSSPPSLDIYHTSFSRDPLSIQLAVYGIFFLDVFQSIVVAAVGWQVLVAGWGRPVNIEFPGWSFAATPFLSGVSEYRTQLLSHIHRLLA